eukprot:SAG31_NODE_641_length_13313_cov_5.365219_3_plen_295_part_00
MGARRALPRCTQPYAWRHRCQATGKLPLRCALMATAGGSRPRIPASSCRGTARGTRAADPPGDTVPAADIWSRSLVRAQMDGSQPLLGVPTIQDREAPGTAGSPGAPASSTCTDRPLLQGCEAVATPCGSANGNSTAASRRCRCRWRWIIYCGSSALIALAISAVCFTLLVSVPVPQRHRPPSADNCSFLLRTSHAELSQRQQTHMLATVMPLKAPIHPPAAPANLSVACASEHQLLLRWSLVPGATSYAVYVDDWWGKNTSFGLVAVVTNNSYIMGGSACALGHLSHLSHHSE